MIRYSFDLDSFVRDHLQGDWRSLADLSLTEMQYSPDLYGFPLNFKDCDETGFMWEIYNRIWGLERMSESPPMEGGTAPRIWRGDTINSFRTMFGSEIVCGADHAGGSGVVGFKGLRRNAAEDELFGMAYEFWHTYCLIGNFLPLPNAKCFRRTMNTYRTVWRDYFDRFLADLRRCLVEGVEDGIPGRATMDGLVSANDYFWDSYGGRDGWERYVREFMLEDYCHDDYTPRRLYDDVWYWRRSLPHGEYVKACRAYVDTASGLIRRRSVRMAARLEELAHGTLRPALPVIKSSVLI